MNHNLVKQQNPPGWLARSTRPPVRINGRVETAARRRNRSACPLALRCSHATPTNPSLVGRPLPVRAAGDGRLFFFCRVAAQPQPPPTLPPLPPETADMRFQGSAAGDTLGNPKKKGTQRKGRGRVHCARARSPDLVLPDLVFSRGAPYDVLLNETPKTAAKKAKLNDMGRTRMTKTTKLVSRKVGVTLEAQIRCCPSPPFPCWHVTTHQRNAVERIIENEDEELHRKQGFGELLVLRGRVPLAGLLVFLGVLLLGLLLQGSVGGFKIVS